MQAITHQTCLKQVQVYQLLRVMDLEKQVLDKFQISEKPQPSILIECLPAPDPVALALEAIEEE